MLTSRRVAEGAAHLRRIGAGPPRLALVLEERMRGFSNELAGLTVVQQRSVPGFPQPRRGVPGGRFLFGTLDGLPVAVAEGGPRLCEGYLPGECGLTVGILAAFGASSVVLVAAGRPLGEGGADGTVLALSDRIDATGVAHLKGVGDAAGVPLVDVPALPSEAAACARAAGAATGVAVATGVAALVHGPLLPSPAERRALRLLGADAWTTGLAPELAAAARAGVRHAALLVLGDAWGLAHLEFLKAFLAGFGAAPGEGSGPTGGPRTPDAPPAPPGLDDAPTPA